MTAPSNMFTWNVTSASEELNFYIYLILINLREPDMASG